MLNEIIKKAHSLTSTQQKDVLEYMKSLPSSGERGYPRKKVRMEVDAVAGDKLIQADIRDMSASGIYIKMARKFQGEKEVKVVFSVPGQGRPFKLDGEIVRVESNGIAITFKDLSPYIKDMLDDTIWK